MDWRETLSAVTHNRCKESSASQVEAKSVNFQGGGDQNNAGLRAAAYQLVEQFRFCDITMRIHLAFNAGIAWKTIISTGCCGANALNQYTNRTVPGTNDVMGVALATNAVTVNGGDGVSERGIFPRAGGHEQHGRPRLAGYYGQQRRQQRDGPPPAGADPGNLHPRCRRQPDGRFAVAEHLERREPAHGGGKHHRRPDGRQGA